MILRNKGVAHLRKIWYHNWKSEFPKHGIRYSKLLMVKYTVSESPFVFKDGFIFSFIICLMFMNQNIDLHGIPVFHLRTNCPRHNERSRRVLFGSFLRWLGPAWDNHKWITNEMMVSENFNTALSHRCRFAIVTHMFPVFQKTLRPHSLIITCSEWGPAQPSISNLRKAGVPAHREASGMERPEALQRVSG